MVEARAKAWKAEEGKVGIKGLANPMVQDMVKVEARAKAKIVQDKRKHMI